MRYAVDKWNNRTFLFPGLFILMILAGCGEEEAANEEGTQENNESGEEDNVIEVEHALGTAEIEGEPERIVTLYQGATDTAAALDIEPVGAVESWLEQPMYEYLRDDLEDVEIVGDEIQPNLEEIAALEPDLIVGTLSRHEEVYDQLDEIAPTVMTDPINDFKHTLDIMGEATDQEDTAKQLLQDWDERVADFQSQVEDEVGEEWPLSTSVLNIRSDEVRMFMGGFPGSILDEAGFAHTDVQQEAINDEEDFLAFTNRESIPEMDAEVFFIFTQGNQEEDELEEAMENWTSHPLWDELDAVENDEVYMVNEVTWNMGGGYIAANHMLDDLYEVFDLEPEEPGE
ncbi:iron complex transport system substrate-binding protein [Geomicrobium halophilum]|uniref:Iron complex transport system substrate-binding protein n=1 Tax=Geomicrobium halophilum TaxID=549000 RepID=A0A841Q2P9_9BACL|nr:iron-siderophore ABC transporter substrate-binding protein [Geomicrobium halophilum]MBB6451068.1 iron complex transport system substrate-binding protein [Geomicrobium halophilum]